MDTPGSTTGVELEWSGGQAPYDLYRALAKADIAGAGDLIGADVSSPRTLLDQTEPILYYWVEDR